MIGQRIQALALAVALAGCGSAPERELVVLAAASLTDAFGRIADDYRAEYGVVVHSSFAGSQVLAAQLEAGIDVDAIAVANPAIMARLAERGLVRQPVRFASNRLVWVTRRDVDAGFDRLAGSELRIVLAAPEVPAGRYARDALRRLDLLEAAEARLVSLELDVKGVVSKLLLAGADAGITYATDITARERETLRVQAFPEAADVRASYLVAATSTDGERFVAFVLGARGRERLQALGFGAP